jgi:hypothetical protein
MCIRPLDRSTLDASIPERALLYKEVHKKSITYQEHTRNRIKVNDHSDSTLALISVLNVLIALRALFPFLSFGWNRNDRMPLMSFS